MALSEPGYRPRLVDDLLDRAASNVQENFSVAFT